MSKAIIIGGGIIVLAAAASPYFCGQALESKFDQKVKDIQTSLQLEPSLKIEITDYQRGWFSSTAKMTLTVENEPIVIDNKITHGPWSYFGLGKIESSIELPEQVKQPIDKLFNGQAPLTITSGIGFSGYKSLEVFSPTIDNQPLPNKPNTTVSWGGIQGGFTIAGDQVVSDLKIPALKISEKSNFFEMIGITLTGSSVYFGENDWASAANKNWAGDSVLNIEKLAFRKYDESFGTSFNLSAKSTDENSNNTVSYNLVAKFANIELPKQAGVTISKSDTVEFGIGLDGLPKKQLADLVAKLNELQKSGKTPSEAEMAMMAQDLVVAYLQGTPSVTGHAILTSDKGNASIYAEAKLATPDTAADFMSLVFGAQNRLVITVSPSIAESLIDEAIATGKLPISKDEFIQEVTKDNRFILNNGVFSGKFEYKQGNFYSNGQLDTDLSYGLQGVLPRGLF